VNDTSTLAHFETFLKTSELPLLGPDPRSSRETLPELEKKLKAAFATAKTPAKNISLIRSLVLLWHDHLDESHTISQDIHTPDGSFLHGIMHRREPDYWNSKYWFQRVGKHPAFPEMAKRVSATLKNESPELLQRLVKGDEWDPFAFVDECEKAMKNSSVEIPVLQRIQEIEFRVLLERLCR
jgi:hypothetical protein